MSSSSTPPVVARLLLPDDANPAGNVHGGTILRLMEEAGMITATRYMAANQEDYHCLAAALVRFENMSFHQPAFVGDVVSLAAHVIFTSAHSVLVGVVVTAEDVSRNKTRVTNSGQLWYVPMAPGGGMKDWKRNHSDPVTVQVPQLPVPVDDDGSSPSVAAVAEYNKAKLLYEARKRDQKQDGSSSSSSDCLEMDGCLCPSSSCRGSYTAPPLSEGGRTPTESEQRLSQMVLPGDCGISGIAFGGFVMKLMDNAAGCSAFRHCRTNVVTLAISAMDFVHWIKVGDICSIHSKVTFCSARTLEIDVEASVMTAKTIGRDDDDIVVAKGTFVFASIGADHKSLPVPKLKLETEEEMEKSYRGQKRYEMAKRARAKQSAAK